VFKFAQTYVPARCLRRDMNSSLFHPNKFMLLGNRKPQRVVSLIMNVAWFWHKQETESLQSLGV